VIIVQDNNIHPDQYHHLGYPLMLHSCM